MSKRHDYEKAFFIFVDDPGTSGSPWYDERQARKRLERARNWFHNRVLPFLETRPILLPDCCRKEIRKFVRSLERKDQEALLIKLHKKPKYRSHSVTITESCESSLSHPARCIFDNPFFDLAVSVVAQEVLLCELAWDNYSFAEWDHRHRLMILEGNLIPGQPILSSLGRDRVARKRRVKSPPLRSIESRHYTNKRSLSALPKGASIDVKQIVPGRKNGDAPKSED